MQHCDQTCAHCANNFWRWFKNRLKSQEAQSARHRGDFNAAAATSVVPPR